MSIAVSIKVNDGIVLASDSASTLVLSDEKGHQGVINVYNNADKIFNIHKELPIGIICWGAGGIGVASISTLAKDLRKLLLGENTTWGLDKNNYTTEKVAELVRRFFFEEKYLPTYHDAREKPTLAFFVAGYSFEGEAAELWQVNIDNGECKEPIQVRGQEAFGINWGGEIEAINRLIKGVAPNLSSVLEELGVPKEQIEPAVLQISARSQRALVQSAMPIQDAIDLARFLVQTTIEFIRFNPGAPTVNGPIEIAAITKHEGFKWVQRKHYFDNALNLSLGGSNGSTI